MCENWRSDSISMQVTMDGRQFPEKWSHGAACARGGSWMWRYRRATMMTEAVCIVWEFVTAALSAENTMEGFLTCDSFLHLEAVWAKKFLVKPLEYRQKRWVCENWQACSLTTFTVNVKRFLCFLSFCEISNHCLETNKRPLWRGRLSKHPIWKLTNSSHHLNRLSVESAINTEAML